jgi:hypothetical protein
MKKLLLFILIIIFGLTGCSRELADITNQMPKTRPDDFCLTVEWSTGTLPEPQMFYSYQVKIGPGEKSSFYYCSGDGSAELINIFDLSAENLDGLYFYLVEESAFRSTWETGDPIDGGPVVYITLTADKRQFAYPLISELSEADRNLAYAILEAANSYVPEECWTEMNRLQLQSEAAYEE